MKPGDSGQNGDTQRAKGRIFLLIGLLAVSISSNIFFLIRLNRDPRPIPSTEPASLTKFLFLNHEISFQEGRGKKYQIASFESLRLQMAEFIDRTLASKQTTLEGSPGRIAVYVEDLTTGAWLGIAERDKFMPLSLLKVPLAIAAVRKVDRGEWTMAQQFTITVPDIDTRPGAVIGNANVSPGQSHSLTHILERLLIESDNNFYFVLRRLLSDREIEDVLYHLGMVYPEDPASRAVSPKNYATIFRSLYHSTYLRPESADYLLSLMNRAVHVYGIRAAIAPEFPVSHKMGLFYPGESAPQPAGAFMHDVGVVYLPNSPFLVAVMTANLRQSAAAEAIREITRLTFEFYRPTSGN